MPYYDRRRFLLLAGVLADGCHRKDASARTLLRVGVVPQPSMASLYLAYESGYFRELGIDVEMVPFTSGTSQSLPLLVSGKMHALFSGFNPASVNARAQGARFRIVAGREVVARNCSDFGVIYGNRKFFPNGLNDVRQLKGKRIAVSLPTGTTFFALDVVLANVGLSTSDVQLVYLREPEAIATLRAGKIHAWVAQNQHDPKLNQVFAGFVSNPGLAAYLPEHQYSFIYFGPDLLDTPVELGGRFLASYLRGARDFLAGRTPQFLVDFARRSGIDPEQMKQQCRATFTPDGTVRTKALTYYVNWAVRRGYCAKVVPWQDLVDLRFLEYAHRLEARRAKKPA